MINKDFRKYFVIGIIVLFVGTSIIPTISGSIGKLSNKVYTEPIGFLNGDIIYVDDDSACPGDGTFGWPYCKIQYGIDNASDGDTIIVHQGTYYENQITINKVLTIQGAGWATTIIDGSDATLSSCGLVRIIANGDVIFQGFTVRNAGGPPNSGDYNDDLTNVGIYAQSASSGATYNISNNKILGTNEPDDWEDYGFYTNSGVEHLIFTNNVVTQTAANSILIEKHIGITEITYNTLDAGCWGIDPIYCMTYSGTDITSLQKISYNIIDVSTGVNPHGPSDNKVTAIGFSSAFLGCREIQDSGKYTNIEISNNTINNLQAYERGIALDNFAWDDGSLGEISNAIIKGNIINGISTTPTSFGIRLSGLVSNTIIRENNIKNCDMSFWGRTGYYGDSIAYPTSTSINYNNFEDNGQGLVWEGPELLNAKNNWWGDASGPQHSGNPGGLGDPISGNVDYSPWLLHPYGADTVKPVVNIISPEQGYIYINLLGGYYQFKIPVRPALFTLLIGSMDIEVSATDNIGLDCVKFYIDEELRATVTEPPYKWTWNEKTLFYPYKIKVIAFDYSGNENSDEIKVYKIQIL